LRGRISMSLVIAIIPFPLTRGIEGVKNKKPEQQER